MPRATRQNGGNPTAAWVRGLASGHQWRVRPGAWVAAWVGAVFGRYNCPPLRLPPAEPLTQAPPPNPAPVLPGTQLHVGQHGHRQHPVHGPPHGHRPPGKDSPRGPALTCGGFGPSAKAKAYLQSALWGLCHSKSPVPKLLRKTSCRGCFTGPEMSPNMN